jgi:hypothetical protein
MEARLYVDDTRDLERLGSRAGDLYICSRGSDENGTYLVLVTDAEQLNRVRDCGLEAQVTWADLDEKFRLMTGADPHETARPQDFGYYLTFWEVQDTLTALAANFPEICSLYSMGPSHLGKEMYVLKISDNPRVAEGEPACYFTGATHGSEPIGTSFIIEFARQCLSGYNSDPYITWLVDNREIYLVPIVNPDASVWCSDSGGANAYWHKNRRQVVPPHIGVDLARNHGYKWGYDDVGSSPSPAAHAYRGPNAWSEPETQNILAFQSAHQFRTIQNFHSFGGYNAYPWTWTRAAPLEQTLLQEVVDTFQMYNGYADTLTGQGSHVLYYANGTQLDWEFADTAGKFVSYSFVIEADTWFYACWNDSALLQKECDRNVPILFYLARSAGVYFDPVASAVNDSGLGNATGRLDPGETANIWFTIRNRAIHPLDSAHDISAKLVSLDTLVTVLDSVKSFPDVQRRSDTDNGADQFLVRASGFAQPGDTIPFRLEVTFTDAGSSMMMPVAFEVVLGEDVIAVLDAGTGPLAPAGPGVTVVGHVLFLNGDCPRTGAVPKTALLDATGRKVLDLRRGANDVSRLSPGVYFIRGEDSEIQGFEGSSRQSSAVHRVVVAR